VTNIIVKQTIHKSCDWYKSCTRHLRKTDCIASPQPSTSFPIWLNYSITIHTTLPIYLSICLSVCLPVYLSIYGSTALFVGLWLFFQFLNPIHSRQDSLDGDGPIVRTLPTHRLNAHRHPCLKLDSNPRSQC
jgi:hypothetical protein